MKTKSKNTIGKKWLIPAISLAFLAGTAVYAASTPQFNQAIAEGAKSVDVVDGSGNSVASPAVSFSAANFSFSTQDTTGTLGTAGEKIRALNPTSGVTWTVNLAGNATTSTWTTGSQYYDFNDPGGYIDQVAGGDADSYGGQMTVNPSDAGAVLAGVSGCATTNVTKGTADSFVEGSVNSIDLMSAAAGASTFCRWDLTGVSLTQKVPAGQAAGSYSISMTLTIS